MAARAIQGAISSAIAAPSGASTPGRWVVSSPST